MRRLLAYRAKAPRAVEELLGPGEFARHLRLRYARTDGDVGTASSGLPVDGWEDVPGARSFTST